MDLEQKWGPTVKQAAKEKAKVGNSDIRSAYYELTDKVPPLVDAIKGDKVLAKDKTLLKLAQDIDKAVTAFHKQLDANYIWD